jgi:two-component system repressor protein LuxO
MNTATAPRVLLVEDTDALATAYAMQLGNEGIGVDAAGSAEQARARLAAGDYAVVLLDLQLPDADGFDILREIRARSADTRVIMITADASLDRVVGAMRMGAHDYLVKPIRPSRLVVTVRNALETVELRRRISSLQGEAPRQAFQGFVGASRPMQVVYQAIENVAESKATVFITGESGTGKEVCAEAIHRCGQRRARPFVAINCGAIPRDLMESEIFGHLKGAFTGAVSNRDGAASLAHGGTLFLDEICEMDAALQTKLLRFLQTGTIQRVGSQKTEQVDVRVLCATNRDPAREVAAGRFREDLYYRLNVIPIHMPPLRERGEDVLLIARVLLVRLAGEEGKAFRDFAPEAAEALLRYSWPGNVRELQNVVRRVVVMNQGERVARDMLPESVRDAGTVSAVPGAAPAAAPELPVPAAAVAASAATDGWVPEGLDLAAIERIVIETTIARCRGNVPEAARRLGVSPSTLYRKRAGWS